MNYEDLAFANRQLAVMLKSGLPLEGSLRQLCHEMRRGKLRDEFTSLEKDLADGQPLEKALAARRLPELYSHLLRVGLKSNNMPGVLTLVADYYQLQFDLNARLKGVLFYPLIVLAGSFVLALFSALAYDNMASFSLAMAAADMSGRSMPGFTQLVLSDPTIYTLFLFAPSTAIAILLILFALALWTPGLRQRIKWFLPILKEASCAQLAASLGLMLGGGASLRDTVALLRQLEKTSPLARELAFWSEKMAQGCSRFSEIAGGRRLLPGLFVWLVTSAGEDLAGGFRQAAELYQRRALGRSEIFLQTVLPVSVMVLGAVIIVQAYSLFTMILGLGLNFLSLF